MLKHLLYTILLVCTFSSVHGQESVPYSRAIENIGLYNPSYNGLSRDLRVDLLFRDQWSGFEGAPVSCGMHLRGGLEKHDLGFGLLANVESIGLRTNSLILGQVNTGIRLSRTSHLHFGMSSGVIMNRYDWTDSNEDIGTDPETESRNEFFTGVGLNYQNGNFVVGTSFNYGSQKSDIENYFSGAVHMEYVHTINTDWNYEMALLASLRMGYTPIYDIKSGISYMDRFDFDLIYRNHGALASCFSVTLREKLVFSYSYQMSLGETQNLAHSSNEIGLRYTINDVKPIYKRSSRASKSDFSKEKKEARREFRTEKQEVKKKNKMQLRSDEFKVRMKERSDRLQLKMKNDASKLREKMQKDAEKLREKMRKDAEKARARMEKVREDLKIFIRQFKY